MKKPGLYTVLSPALLNLYEVTNNIVVVIDVLRATSTIATVLYNGAKEIIPVDSVERCIQLGKEFDIKPAGLGARDTLRLEMGFCLYGNDIDDSTSPIEAGLGWITKFTKDFTAKDKLQDQKEKGIERKLVGFEMVDRGIPRHGYEIKDQAGALIGYVTSGTQSPSLNKAIGMGYVRTAYAAEDTPIFVKVRDKLLQAKIVKMPFS